MFQHQGIWLPDGEKHFPEWMTRNGEIVNNKGTYQIKKWRACLPNIRAWRTAVDVGAHVGLWSMHMVKRFANLHAFEPVPHFMDCCLRNVEPQDSCVTWIKPYALGAQRGKVSMAIDPKDTGGTHVGGDGDVELFPLDEFNLSDVDFIKIDCEGYEHNVIAGAQETILRSKPCIIVEQKPHKLGPNFGIKGTPAVDALKALGYRVAKEIGGDYIMVSE